MDIVIDLSRIENFFALPPGKMLWVFVGNFGWMIIAVLFIYGVLQLYLFYIRGKWASGHKYILLAIDIPKDNEQTPKAVENMFTYLGGAHGTQNFFETWFEGEFQKSFSYEIVSLEGYTQFLIRTPSEYRNLIESSVYSQYPDAEISEVDDYVNSVPHRFPDDDYDIWGTEFIQSGPFAYPIKCYEEFEHKSGPLETQFKDPMATLMDLCGSLRQGEQLWLQFIVTPIGFDWIGAGEREIDKILGKKPKKKKDIFMMFLEWLGDLSENIISIWGDAKDNKESEDKALTMFDLNPKQQKQLEAISRKTSKLGFEMKIRAVYIAKKEVMNKAKVANGLVGFIKQFTALDLNGLKPDVKKTMTKAVYFFKKSRLNRKKNRLMQGYINRDSSIGMTPGTYNIEEMATLWHFPLEASVRSVLMQKVEGRKADAPATLPVDTQLTTAPDDFFSSGLDESIFIADDKEREQVEKRVEPEPSVGFSLDESEEEQDSDQAGKAPSNLPFA